MKGSRADDFHCEKGWKHNKDEGKQVQYYCSKHRDTVQDKHISTFDSNTEKQQDQYD
jgi:hypothetical protein